MGAGRCTTEDWNKGQDDEDILSAPAPLVSGNPLLIPQKPSSGNRLARVGDVAGLEIQIKPRSCLRPGPS